MLFVIIGVAIIAMNLAGVGWFAAWNWDFTGDLWKFCVPFGLAALWWMYADSSGLNKRREIAKMDARKQNRRRENLEALGLNARSFDRNKDKVSKFQTARQREIEKIEGKREKQRQHNRESILSGFDHRGPGRGESVLPDEDAKG